MGSEGPETRSFGVVRLPSRFAGSQPQMRPHRRDRRLVDGRDLRLHVVVPVTADRAMTIETDIPLLEEILGQRRTTLGDQLQPYKNHVYRVTNFCFALHDCRGDDREKILVAGCFHDLGIWPDDEVDYLAPSIDLAREYLNEKGKEGWSTEIGQMIDLHHQLRSVKDGEFPLVEAFRKADLVDVSLGLRTFGLPRSFVRSVRRQFPNLGFHRNLVRLTGLQLRRDPLNPLPMMRW